MDKEKGSNDGKAVKARFVRRERAKDTALMKTAGDMDESYSRGEVYRVGRINPKRLGQLLSQTDATPDETVMIAAMHAEVDALMEVLRGALADKDVRGRDWREVGRSMLRNIEEMHSGDED